jgi:hypothetical protein
MSPQTKRDRLQPLDLSKWRKAPALLIVAGGSAALLGFFVDRKEFAYSWLLAFMFCLSLCLGALFLVMVHHLFDAGWSVPIRRFNEHIASLVFPWMALLFLPIALLAPTLYQWMRIAHPALNHSVNAKWPLFTRPGYYLAAVMCFLVWWLLSNRLRYWSIKQDETGAAQCTYRMRFYSYWGIFAFALTLTLAAILWMSGLAYDWYSTMYGVYYFAGSVWVALAVTYIITMVLHRQNVLADVLHENQYYFIGSILFAFTVFYAYIHFAQYFIIWNANVPEETFWYVIRQQGTWWWIGLVIIFGHFFIPFLALLRIDVKSIFPYMTAICIWTGLMHYVDLSFNIMPAAHPDGFPLKWVWLHFACLAFMGGVLANVFLAKYAGAAPYPVKDPRLLEAMGHYHPVPTPISGEELDEAGHLPDAPQAGHAK